MSYAIETSIETIVHATPDIRLHLNDTVKGTKATCQWFGYITKIIIQ